MANGRMGQSMGGREREGSAVVTIGGKSYDRMLSLTLKRSKEECTCEGTVVFSWPGAEQFNLQGMVARDLVDGAEGTITLDGQLAATIIIDQRISKGTPKHYELTFQFRGRCSTMVDSSPRHETGQIDKQQPQQIVQQLLQGLPIQMEGSMQGEKIERFVIDEGETVERAARRAVREQGGVFWENERGNLEMEKRGQHGGGSGSALILGKNITHWSVKRDIAPRFAQYDLMGNGIPTDDRYGKQNESIMAQGARNLFGGASVKRLRGLIDSDMTQQLMQQRQETEGDRREGQGLNVTVRTSTWTDDGGQLWHVNNKHYVSIPVDSVDTTCVIQEVIFELTPDSRNATITLVSEDVWMGGTGASSVLFNGNQPVAYTPPQQPSPATPDMSTEELREIGKRMLDQQFNR